jgi:hypothetical protein
MRVLWMCWISEKSWCADVVVAVGVRGGVVIAVAVRSPSLENVGCAAMLSSRSVIFVGSGGG